MNGNTTRSPRAYIMNVRVKRFCFTLNNYTEDDIKKLQEYAQEWTQFAIIGKEIAPTTGTPHLQGYM